MEETLNVAKLVHDYLARFYKHYKLDKDQTDTEFADWCLSNLGREYRNWMYHPGGSYDTYSVIHILDPGWCTVFELRWAHLIIGTIDIKQI